jgi:hypothetical protein
MRSIIFRGILAATAVLAAACSSDASVAPTIARTTAPSTARRDVSAGAANVSSMSRLIDQYVWVSCTNGGAGEAVRVTGELHYEVQRTTDASGGLHLNFKSATSGLTAVGQTSGTFFRGLMTEHITSRAEDELNMDVRTADIIRFVAPGSGESYSLMATSHFVVDQGSYVLWDQTWNEVCR